MIIFKNCKVRILLLSLIIVCYLFGGCGNESSSDYGDTVDSYSVISDSDTTSGQKSAPSVSQSTLCAATPCPNYALTGSSYCEVHKSGKTNKCLECGTSIWADEIFCDTCLLDALLRN